MPTPRLPGAVGGSHHALIRAGACHLLSLGTNPYSRAGAERPFLGQGVKREEEPMHVPPTPDHQLHCHCPAHALSAEETLLLAAHGGQEKRPVQAQGAGSAEPRSEAAEAGVA